MFVLFSHQVVSNSLQAPGLHHARLSCPSHHPEFAQIHVHWIGDSILKINIYKKISLPRDSGSIGLE